MSAYFMVNDADGLYEFHRANEVEIPEPIGDREYGIRDYSVRDLDGNLLVFGHPLYTLGEKIKIERVDVRCGWRRGWRRWFRIWRNTTA